MTSAIATTLRFDIKLPRLGYSLNARVHWGERARVNGLLKDAAWAYAWSAARDEMAPRDSHTRAYLQLHVVWPHDKRGPLPDEDSLAPSLKSCADGIAKALLVDDSPKWCDYRKPTQEKGSHTGYVLVRAEVGPV